MIPPDFNTNPGGFACFASLIQVKGTVIHDTAYYGSAEECYGYLPLEYLLPVEGDEKEEDIGAGVTVKSVEGLPAGQGSITTGMGRNLVPTATTGRANGVNYSNKNCLIITYLPDSYSLLQGSNDGGAFYLNANVTVTLEHKASGQVSEPIPLSLTYIGLVPVDND